ncbi:DUF1801 domain-containing protein [Martelella sp. FLE1502]
MMNEIVEQLKTVILSVEPNAAFIEKYGGIVVESVPGHSGSQFCGVFAHAHQVSLEFSRGAQLADPDRILEGSGKHRRHIKLASLSDIAEKRCEPFLRQASRLQNV